MKLLFLIKSLSLLGGGAERVLADVTAGLSKRAHDVIIATYDDPRSSDFYEIHPNVRRLRLGIGDVSHPAKPIETLRRMTAVRRVVRQHNPDVVIAFMQSAYIPLGIALKGTGVPLIASEHIVFDHYKTVPFHSALLWITPILAHAMTATSQAVKDSFPLKIRRLMTVIPNPVGAPPTLSSDVRGGTRKTVLNVGRMVKQKDQAVLITAFAKLASAHPDWGLRIVGNGLLRDDLIQQSKTLGIADRVEFPGVKPDVSAEYLGAQIFAMSSRYESFGLVTAEALSHGLPVVGFADCPGTNELIADGHNGLLVSGPDRVAALADGLERLMASEELRVGLGKVGPQTVSAFSIEGVVGQWEELLLSVVASSTIGDSQGKGLTRGRN